MTVPLQDSFERAGGIFNTRPEEIRERLGRVRAFLLDWDGVFNAGTKGVGLSSSWSEADSMGLNLLRFGWWLRDHRLPPILVVTGQNNPSALQLAERERFQGVYQGFLDKSTALDHALEMLDLDAKEVAFVFDDVLDLAVARRVGVQFLIGRAASPLYRHYVMRTKACDYVTGREGGRHAVREVAELMLGLAGLYDTVVEQRAAFSKQYAAYLAKRQVQTVRHFRWEAGVVERSG